MGRLTPFLLGVGGVFLFSFALFGGGGGFIHIVVLGPLAVIGIGIGWWVFGRVGRTVELGWAGNGDVTTAVAAAPTFAALRPPSTERAVAAALGRFEARKHATSTWFAVGLAFLLLLVALFGWVWVEPGQHWREMLVLMPVMAYPMVGMAIGAGHLSITRARRDGAVELFDACPAEATTRTLGHLRASWVPVAAIAAFVVAMLVSIGLHDHAAYGSIDNGAIADLLTAVALGACGAALGVALGRWAPWRLAPVVAIFAVLAVSQRIGQIGDPHWSNARQLSTWPRYPPHDLLFTDRPAWWHLVWIVSLGALMTVIAVVRSDRSRRVLIAGAVVVVALAVSGVMETRPISAAAARRIASLVVEPAKHQTCVRASRVQVCAYDDQDAVRSVVLAVVAPIAAAAPDGTPEVVMRQRFDGRVEHLGPEVAAAVAQLTPGPELDDLAFGFSREADELDASRIRAATSIAIPGRGGEPQDHTPLVVAGQSRGVVLLWLAARGLGREQAIEFATVHFDPHSDGERAPDALSLGNQGMWPDGCGTGSPPVLWSRQDLAAARQLLAVPSSDVRDLLSVNWGLVTDPTFGTDELMTLAGLPAVGPFDHIESRSTDCG